MSCWLRAGCFARCTVELLSVATPGGLCLASRSNECTIALISALLPSFPPRHRRRKEHTARLQAHVAALQAENGALEGLLRDMQATGALPRLPGVLLPLRWCVVGAELG